MIYIYIYITYKFQSFINKLFIIRFKIKIKGMGVCNAKKPIKGELPNICEQVKENPKSERILEDMKDNN